MRLWGNLSSCARPGGYPVYRRNWRVGTPPQAASPPQAANWERWPEQWTWARKTWDRFKGRLKASTMGPHICTQCRLLTKPKTKTSPSSSISSVAFQAAMPPFVGACSDAQGTALRERTKKKTVSAAEMAKNRYAK